LGKRRWLFCIPASALYECRNLSNQKPAVRGRRHKKAKVPHSGTLEGNDMASTIVALVDDLFFLAKIRETAKAIGVTVVTGNSRTGSDAIAKSQPQAIILDLNSLPTLDWIQTLKADPATRPIRIVAFVSHVQEQLISAARAAGCDSVMARSAFTQQLPSLLRSLINESAMPG
jgi:DNA-binding NarL/FixJ family response regulator